MVRTTRLLAAAATGALAFGLRAPATAAAPVFGNHVVGSASCLGPGNIRFAVRQADSGGVRAVAQLSGVGPRVWLGSVDMGPTAASIIGLVGADGQYDSVDVLQMKRYVAHGGRITASAHGPKGDYLGPEAYFSADSGDDCSLPLIPQPDGYIVSSGEANLDVNDDRSVVRVDLPSAREGDRYRGTFTVVRRDGSVARRVVERVASGRFRLTVSAVRHLVSSRRVSARVVDLTDRSVEPITVSIAR